MLKKEEVLAQSEAAFSQWGPTWDSHAKINGELYREKGVSHKDVLYKGIGKQCICVSNGPSLEAQIEVLKENYNPELQFIACVDKSLGTLVDAGLTPDLLIVCDASVDYETWMKPWEDATKDIMLGCCITANPEWSKNWKGPICFFVNKDNIDSQIRYSQISGCGEMIPAGSNVGNSVIIFTTQIMAFDEWLLIGYDYCWGEDNYYAYNDPAGKRHWMKHIQMIDQWGRIVNTSQNLLFSARWLGDYYKMIVQEKGCNIYNCSGFGILNMPRLKFERKLKSFEKRKITDKEKQMIIMKKADIATIRPDQGDEALQAELKKPVVDVTVRTISTEDAAWLQAL